MKPIDSWVCWLQLSVMKVVICSGNWRKLQN